MVRSVLIVAIHPATKCFPFDLVGSYPELGPSLGAKEAAEIVNSKEEPMIWTIISVGIHQLLLYRHEMLRCYLLKPFMCHSLP